MKVSIFDFNDLQCNPGLKMPVFLICTVLLCIELFRHDLTLRQTDSGVHDSAALSLM